MALKLVTFHDRFSTIPPTHHHNHPTSTTPQPPQPRNHHNHHACSRYLRPLYNVTENTAPPPNCPTPHSAHLFTIFALIPHTYSRFLRPLGSIILQKNTAPPLIAPAFHTARAPHLFTILATALDRRRKFCGSVATRPHFPQHLRI